VGPKISNKKSKSTRQQLGSRSQAKAKDKNLRDGTRSCGELRAKMSQGLQQHLVQEVQQIPRTNNNIWRRSNPAKRYFQNKKILERNRDPGKRRWMQDKQLEQNDKHLISEKQKKHQAAERHDGKT